MDKIYTMGEVTSAARATRRAVRIWAEKGLLGDVKRDERGERVFTDAQRTKARIISAAQMAGMSLDEIKASDDAKIYAFIVGASRMLDDVQRGMRMRGFDL